MTIMLMMMKIPSIGVFNPIPLQENECEVPCLCGSEDCKKSLSKDFTDDEFDNALFDLLVQACSVHASKDCTKVECEICICLKTMHATLAALGFGANLSRGAPLWVLLFCCLTIKKFQLNTTTGSSNGKNFLRMHSSSSAEEDEQIHEDLASDVMDRTIGRIKKLATIVEHVVSSLSNLRCLKDVSPLLPLEYFFEKEKIIQSIESQFGEWLQLNIAANCRIRCRQDHVCFVLKICNGHLQDIENHYYINITNHKWFETFFKCGLLFLGALQQPVMPTKSAKKIKRECGNAFRFSASAGPMQVDDNDDDDWNDNLNHLLSSTEQTQFQVLDSEEIMGRKPAKHQSIIYCIRQLKLEQDNLSRSIEIQRRYVRKIEASVCQGMAAHNLYFEYLCTSPTSDPKFSSPASVETITAIAMSLTTATTSFPFPEGSILATLPPHQEDTVVTSRPYSKLSIGSGRVRCSHCNVILNDDSVKKHMMRKHSGILPKQISAASVMPEQFRYLFSKVR